MKEEVCIVQKLSGYYVVQLSITSIQALLCMVSQQRR